MNNIRVSSPSRFKKAFIIVSAHGWHFVVNSRVTAAALSLLLQLPKPRWGCISSSGGKQGGLGDALPGMCDSSRGAREPLGNISST